MDNEKSRMHQDLFYKAYTLVRIKEGAELDFIDELKKLAKKENWHTERGSSPQIVYAVPIYGNYDVLIEIKYSDLEDHSKVLTKIRSVLKPHDSLTYTGSTRTFPWDIHESNDK
jgi:hypothetical protein